jgi:hypothetical protein
MILYPAFEQYLGAEGKKIADEDRAEHEKVCAILLIFFYFFEINRSRNFYIRLNQHR